MTIKSIQLDPLEEQRKLTFEIIDRIELVLQKLTNQRNPNAQAVKLFYNLTKSKSYDEKRKWIVLFYIDSFQLISFINMAKSKDIPLDDFKIELAMLFREKSVE